MLYFEAIDQAILKVMQEDEGVVLLGEDVAAPKHAFGTTASAHNAFPERVLATPVSETMMTGACVGLAMEGFKPIYVHARADFAILSFEHLINTASKLPFLHDKPLPFVMRAVVGRGWGQGPVHSQSLHNTLCQVPGLTVVVPVFGERYIDHLKRAFQMGTPTVIIEPRRLYTESVNKLTRAVTMPDRCNIHIIVIGDAILDAVEARSILGELDIEANIWAMEYIEPFTVLPEPSIVVDISARPYISNVVAPPFVPQGASLVYERAWYPTADEIVRAVCSKLGASVPDRRNGREQFAPSGSPF